MDYEAIKARQTELARRMMTMQQEGVGTLSPRYIAARDEFRKNAYILKNKPGTCRGSEIN